MHFKLAVQDFNIKDGFAAEGNVINWHERRFRFFQKLMNHVQIVLNSQNIALQARNKRLAYF